MPKQPKPVIELVLTCGDLKRTYTVGARFTQDFLWLKKKHKRLALLVWLFVWNNYERSYGYKGLPVIIKREDLPVAGDNSAGIPPLGAALSLCKSKKMADLLVYLYLLDETASADPLKVMPILPDLPIGGD